MNCNCKSIEPARIRHVFGNVFRLGIPLAKRIVTISEGMKDVEDGELSPLQQGAPIKVVFSFNRTRHEYTAEFIDGFVVVEDKGRLPIGTYDVTVLATDSNGDPLRFKDNLILGIVDSTAEANYDGAEKYDGFFKCPIITYGGGRPSLIVVTDNAVQIHEGTGFAGKITDDAVKLYARYGQSSMDYDEDSVNITIN